MVSSENHWMGRKLACMNNYDYESYPVSGSIVIYLFSTFIMTSLDRDNSGHSQPKSACKWKKLVRTNMV